MDVAALTAAMTAEGIDSRRYFHPPIHRQKAYAGMLDGQPLPVTDQLSARVITPPLWSDMGDADVRALADLFVRLHVHAAAVVRGQRFNGAEEPPCN